ncbi:enoyl-CoA hydratase/isomerase family protein [Ascidiaceihabitans sp.]|uniref:enoyl-CoA hydratase/isomerase family protein n=1 Tax=Ascidiaceihabitans sp. TaxID=1872644 RepID=UPI00329A48BE
MTDTQWITQIKHDGGVIELSLNAAPVNALTPEKLMGYRDVLHQLGADKDVKAIVLTSPLKVLSAGLNLKAAQDFDEAQQKAIVHGLNEGFLAQYSCPKPVICAVNGAAIAGGLFFVLAADHRIADTRAQFGLAEVRVGVDFPVGPMEIARATLDTNTLRRLILRGKPIGAETALAAGLVDDVVEPDVLHACALEAAQEFAQLPPKAFASIKHQIRGDVIAQIKAATTAEPDLWFTDETRPAMQKMLG